MRLSTAKADATSDLMSRIFIRAQPHTDVEFAYVPASRAQAGAGQVSIHAVLLPLRRPLRPDLSEELTTRLTELDDVDAWAEDVGSARTALRDLQVVGGILISLADGTWPHRLNITAADCGEVLVTLFGVGGREAELWLGEEPGQVLCILTDGVRREEVRVPTLETGRVIRYLRGERWGA